MGTDLNIYTNESSTPPIIQRGLMTSNGTNNTKYGRILLRSDSAESFHAEITAKPI